MKELIISLVRFLGRLAIAAVWVFALLLVAWNLARLYPGDRWSLVRMGNFFAPWLFMALAPALAVALLGRRPWLTRLVLVLALVFLGRYWPLLGPRLPLLRAGSDPGELRIMTFNVNYANRSAREIAALIRAEGPDVIAMQELTEELATPLRAELGPDYPYFLADNMWGLTGLISRYPLISQAVPMRVRHTQHVHVETPHGPVSVWNLHLAVAVSQRGWEAQREMATAVAREVARQSGPVIVLGDFNTTDQTDNYRLIAERLTDVHWSVGRGFGFTFPDSRRPEDDPRILRPVVRIDHILVSEELVPQEVRVLQASFGSDHRPVLATLRFAN